MKILISIIVLLSLSFTIKAQHFIKNQGFEVWLHNDSWGGGFTRIHDDLRSFELNIKYISKNQLSIYSRISSITNRFDKDTLLRKRFDEFYIGATIPVIHFSQSDDFIGLNLGFFATGNMFGEEIQNFTHSKFDMTQLDLPYYIDKRIHPTIGYCIIKEIFTDNIKNQNFIQLKIDHSGEYAYRYHYITKLGIPITLKSNNETNVVFRLGYTLTKNLSDNHLLGKVLEAESGFNIGLKMNFQRFFYYFEAYPNNNFSYGGIGIRFLTHKKANKLNNRNFEVEVSMLNKGYSYNFKYSWAFTKLFNRNVKFIINHNFNTFLRNYLSTYPKVNGHGNQVTFGSEIDLLSANKTSRIINPYINMLIGCRMISIYSGSEYFESLKSFHFANIYDLGVKFKFPIYFFSDDFNIIFSVFQRIMLITSDKASEYDRINKNLYKNYQTRFGVGLIFPF